MGGQQPPSSLTSCPRAALSPNPNYRIANHGSGQVNVAIIRALLRAISSPRILIAVACSWVIVGSAYGKSSKGTAKQTAAAHIPTHATCRHIDTFGCAIPKHCDSSSGASTDSTCRQRDRQPGSPQEQSRRSTKEEQQQEQKQFSDVA